MKIKEIQSVNGKEYLSIEEAATMLGIQTAAIRNYLNLDKLTTFKFKSHTFVSLHEVELWKKERQKPR